MAWALPGASELVPGAAIPMLARAAVAAGVDGLFLECHSDPRNAKSDAATMLGVLSGHDPRDSTSVPEPVPDYVAALDGNADGTAGDAFVTEFSENVAASVTSSTVTVQSSESRLPSASVAVTSRQSRRLSSRVPT